MAKEIKLQEKVETISINGRDFVPAESIAQQAVKEDESIYKLGAVLLIRGVTYHYIGRITYLSDTEIVLNPAAWLASSGRFGEALVTGKLSEVEPYPGPASISRAIIADASPWNHPIPREAK
jgi:hypothetical protein